MEFGFYRKSRNFKFRDIFIIFTEYGIWNLEFDGSRSNRVTSGISNHVDFKIPNFKKWGFQNGDL